MLEVSIEMPSKQRRALERLMRTWPDRTRALLVDVPRVVVEKARDAVESLVPKGPDWKQYRRSFRIDRVSGLNNDEAGWLVRAEPRSRRVSRMDSATTVLYVEPKKVPRRIPDEIRILARYSPWTLDTLPFVPKKSLARLVSRRVRPREVVSVARLRKRQMPVWRRALAEVGVRRVHQKGVLESVKTVPDLAFEALRLEMGWGGVKGAHWRPGIRKVVRGFSGIARSHKEWIRTMMDPSYRGWSKPGTCSRISASKLKEYEKFQQILGISV